MPSLWEVITSNSNLPVAPGNNLWDHLNSVSSGGGTIIVDCFSLELHNDEYELEVHDMPDIELDDTSIEVSIDEELELGLED